MGWREFAAVGVRDAAAAASRLIFFFFLELLGIAEAAPTPPPAPAPRGFKAFGVWGVDGEANALDERNLAAAAAAEGEEASGDAGVAEALNDVRTAARAGWANGVAFGVLRAND